MSYTYVLRTNLYKCLIPLKIPIYICRYFTNVHIISWMCWLNGQEKGKTEQRTGHKERQVTTWGLVCIPSFSIALKREFSSAKTDAKQLISQFSVQTNDVIILLFDKTPKQSWIAPAWALPCMRTSLQAYLKPLFFFSTLPSHGAQTSFAREQLSLSFVFTRSLWSNTLDVS